MQTIARTTQIGQRAVFLAPDDYVTIAGPDKYGCYNWQHVRPANGAVLSSRQRFDSIIAAYMGANVVAESRGVAVRLSSGMLGRLENAHVEIGRRLYVAGYDIGECINAWQRNGFEQMADDLDDQAGVDLVDDFEDAGDIDVDPWANEPGHVGITGRL